MNESYIAYARNELTEYLVYGKLAQMEKRADNKALLKKLSAQEHSHYEFWKSLVPDTKINPSAWFLYGVPLMRATFGLTFISKLMESHENSAVARYGQIFKDIPASHQERFKQIIEDEKSHEQAFIGGIKEKRVAYMGFIVLGLADAIVEITGVHAGFLGVTGSTLIAGISGVIVGFAAAISMGSASYLQAKQEIGKSPLLSAFATGVSYFCSVILLALPYFLIRTMLTAFLISTSVGIVLIAGFTFYGAVVFDRKFLHEFGETVALMLGTAGATFVLGTIVGKVFHIGMQSF